MQTTYPGTAIEVLTPERGSSRMLFDGMFAAGGVTLSQVSIMTGLEPYLVQNWVKRGFVSSPVKRLYARDQLARIVIINMLREALQIETICRLIRVIGGEKHDPSDDLIGDEELYHRYVDMLWGGGIDLADRNSVLRAAEAAVEDFQSPMPGAKKQLVRILQVMLYAHAAARFRVRAGEILSELDS